MNENVEDVRVCRRRRSWRWRRLVRLDIPIAAAGQHRRRVRARNSFPSSPIRSRSPAAEIIDFDCDDRHEARPEGGPRRRRRGKSIPRSKVIPEVIAERLAEVISAVSDLKKLSVVTDDRTKHREFGVVDPGQRSGTEGRHRRRRQAGRYCSTTRKKAVGEADRRQERRRQEHEAALRSPARSRPRLQHRDRSGQALVELRRLGEARSAGRRRAAISVTRRSTTTASTSSRQSARRR